MSVMSRSLTDINAFSSSPYSLQSVFDVALEAYEKKTKSKLLTHPLAAQIQSCDSSTAVYDVLYDLIQKFDRRRSSDERLSNWLRPTVNVLFALSVTLAQGPLSPANVIFSGIGILFMAAKDVESSQDALVDIFARIENFFKRLESYTALPPTAALTDVFVKVMIEVLSILAIATEEINLGRSKKIVRKLLGRNDIDDALKRLDTLTMEEARMATSQNLNTTHIIDKKVDIVIEKGQEAYKVTKKVDENVSILINDVKETKAAIQQSVDIAYYEKQTELKEKMHKWLSPSDPSKNQNNARVLHHEGTASWFFQGSIFEEWKASSSLLWIHGKPGSGKSILCSGIVEDIMARRKAESAIVAYFYCDFRDENKQNCRNVVLSTISQLCDQSNICLDRLLLSYLENGKRRPDDKSLTKLLKDMLSLLVQDDVYLIIDALDECPGSSGMPSPREELLNLVEDLVNLDHPKLHICVTSRPEIDIQEVLEPLTSLRVSLHNQSGQKKDLVDYVSSVVYSDRKMKRWREEDRKLVIETLSERAGGMFRWVYCQLQALRYTLAPSLRKVLEDLPDTLDETYERVLKEIGANKANREHARRLLQCLTVAHRPLRVEELAEVIAIDFDHGGIPEPNPNWRWADHQQTLLTTCSSLIAIVDEGDSQVVQFSHFSVKEYLTSDRLSCSSEYTSYYHILPEPAHTVLAQACVAALLRLNDQVNRETAEEIPLVNYAARYWFDHARFEHESPKLRDAMEYFFDADKPHWAAWCQVQTIDEWWGWFTPDEGQDRPSPLYFASLGGFYDVAERLVDKYPDDINLRGGMLITPLVAALRGKHFRVADLLHRHEAYLDVQDNGGHTPLHESCRTGVMDIVQWLVDRGADVNAECCKLYTPVHVSADNGCLPALKLLIARNAKIDIKTVHGKRPLHVAASPNVQRDHVEIMQLLLDKGADPNARDKNGSTPLHHSSWWKRAVGYPATQGTIEGTILLIKHGADVNAKDNDGRTPMQQALENGRKDMAACLSEHGATE